MMPQDRALDPARVAKVESNLRFMSDIGRPIPGPDSYRDMSVLHGFRGKSENGVRLRPSEDPRSGVIKRDEPSDYNEKMTALTNMAASGELYELDKKNAELRDKYPSDYAKREKAKQTPIKINSNPVKGK